MNITAKELKPGHKIIVKGFPCTVSEATPASANAGLIIISWRDSDGQLRFGRAGADTPITIQEGK